MARVWTALILAVTLGTLAACGDDEKPPATQASCNVAAAAFCMDIYGILPTDQNDCTGSGGVWSTAAMCPTANLVGTCTVQNPGAAQTIAVRFYGPTWDDASAASTCASLGGTYTP